MFKKKVKMEQGNKIKNKALNGFILIIVFIILFLQTASADLYLNSKTGTIYFNTTGISRASIGPGGNFSINTSDFFVNNNLGRVGIGTTTPRSSMIYKTNILVPLNVMEPPQILLFDII